MTSQRLASSRVVSASSVSRLTASVSTTMASVPDANARARTRRSRWAVVEHAAQGVDDGVVGAAAAPGAQRGALLGGQVLLNEPLLEAVLDHLAERALVGEHPASICLICLALM